MWQFPAFQAKLKELWEQYSVNFTTDLNAYLQAYVESIKGAAANDAERWQHKGYGNADLQQDLAHVQQFMRDAALWESDRLGVVLPEPTITVRWRPLPEWTNTQMAFVWGDGIKADFVTPTQDGEFYEYTTKDISLNIIFVNGTGWTEKGNQTVDILNLTADACYEVLADTATAELHAGKHLVQAIDCPKTPLVNPSSPISQPTDATKVLRNGRLVIIHQGKEYTILGTRL